MTIEAFLRENLKQMPRQRFLHFASTKYFAHVIYSIQGLYKGFRSGDIKREELLYLFMFYGFFVIVVELCVHAFLHIVLTSVQLFYPVEFSLHEIWLISFFVLIVFMLLLGFIKIYLNPDEGEKIYKSAYKGYVQLGEFTDEEVGLAAKALKNFKPATYDFAVKKHGKRSVDLLVLASGIYCFDGKLKRLISLRALSEDRPAELGDD